MENCEESKKENKSQQENKSLYESYSNKITGLLQFNTQKIKEEYKEIKDKAGDFFKNVYEVVRTNANIKLFLRSNQNYYTNFLFSYFGYKHETKLENAKYFHFVAQAWILNVFDDYHKESSKKEYSEILRDILYKQVEDSNIFQSLELITGTLFISDPAIKFAEERYTNLFLANVREMINQWKNKEINVDLSKNEFDFNIMDILSRAVNLTLNEVDNIDYKNSLILHDSFIELSSNIQELSLINFINYVIQKRESSQKEKLPNDETLRNACEIYYSFARTSLIELINDLELFNKRSTSLLNKFGVILSNRKKSIQTLVASIVSNFGNYVATVQQNIRYNNLKEYYQKAFTNMKDYSDSSLQLVKTKVDLYKDWLNNMKYVKSALYYQNMFYEKASTYSSNSSLYFYDRIYSPFKNVTFLISGDSTEFVIKNVVNIKNNSSKLIDSIRENFNLTYSNLSDYFNQIVKFDVNEKEDLIIIKVSRKNMEKLKIGKFFSLVLENLSVIKFKENVFYLVDKTNGLKTNILDKYRKFLSWKNGDEERKIDEDSNEENKEFNNETTQTVKNEEKNSNHEEIEDNNPKAKGSSKKRRLRSTSN